MSDKQIKIVDVLNNNPRIREIQTFLGEDIITSDIYVDGRFYKEIDTSSTVDIQEAIKINKGKRWNGTTWIIVDNLIDLILHPVNCGRGAPMGRSGRGVPPKLRRIYTRIVKLDEDYDQGGAYWGYTPGNPVLVDFTKALDYVKFYRQKG